MGIRENQSYQAQPDMASVSYMYPTWLAFHEGPRTQHPLIGVGSLKAGGTLSLETGPQGDPKEKREREVLWGGGGAKVNMFHLGQSRTFHTSSPSPAELASGCEVKLSTTTVGHRSPLLICAAGISILFMEIKRAEWEGHQDALPDPRDSAPQTRGYRPPAS